MQPSLSIGPHLIRASYSGHEKHSPPSAEFTQDMLLDATANVSPSTFYPMDDDYLDELDISGVRNVDTSVAVLIESVATGETVFDQGKPSGTGDYRISWSGLLGSTAELAPPGRYDVTVTLDGGGAYPKIVEKTDHAVSRLGQLEEEVGGQGRQADLAVGQVEVSLSILSRAALAGASHTSTNQVRRGIGALDPERNTSTLVVLW